MKKLFAIAVLFSIMGTVLLSCASSSGEESGDTLTEKDLEFFQEILNNEDSLSEEAIDSIIDSRYGKDTAEIAQPSVERP